MVWTKAKTAVVAGAVLILAAGTTTVTVKNSGREAFQRESRERATQSMQWARAFIMFARDHQGQLPKNFEQLKTHASNGDLPGSNWEIVSGGDWNSITNPSRTILFREKEASQSPDGQFVKVYVFADSHAELVASPDTDFAALEKKLGFLIQPATH